MKILHVYRNEPNEEVKKLVSLLNEGNEAMEFNLYEAKEDADYDRLIQMIWEADKTISWW
ncbi:MAG TPA: hypothetical protein ENJ40_02275 [Thermosulfurimonas dismutans]|uniref:Uncharacterized protein n=1 Tax=Thermosulfurimonas dismutans TaxID=999894 RepID=A0A7C3CKR5_9BACT|nr:hypothetical protein [Thermosulfurimonas sp.]HFC97272.1 hypothetical protein [Thermosulfurimonas dismutans]